MLPYSIFSKTVDMSVNVYYHFNSYLYIGITYAILKHPVYLFMNNHICNNKHIFITEVNAEGKVFVVV